MADHTSRDQMYCHACHHQWQRTGEGIECPACMSASTEIINPEHDPRHFHNRQQDPAAVPSAPEPASSQGSEASASPTSASEHPGDEANNTAATDAAGGATAQAETPQPPGVTFRFRTVSRPPIAYFTFVMPPPPQPAGDRPPPTEGPQPAAESSQSTAENSQPTAENAQPVTENTQPANQNTRPATENSPPVTIFNMHFFSPVHIIPMAPPPTSNSSPPAEANQAAQQSQGNDAPQADGHQQQQQQQHTQPPPIGPHPAMPAQMLATLLTSLFHPSAAVMGDAVYSQEAFDRVLAQLREQAPAGGPPPASQAALDRLRMREVDDKVLATQPKCVVCVDDMVRGERAAVLPCEHFFHPDCVTPWLRLHGTCPVCRRSVEADDADPPKKGGASPDQTHSQGPGSAAEQESPLAGGRGETAGGEAMDCS